MTSYPDLSNSELEDLLVSLSDPSDGTASLTSSTSSSPVPRLTLAAPSNNKKRPNRQPTAAVAAEEWMERDERGLPVAVDEETRQARKMARNRRAAAVSRERKKQRVEELEEQVARLQEENARLKRQLAQTDSGSETSETTSDVEWWPISQQPEAFWTYAPLKKDCTPPPLHSLLRRLIASLYTLCLSTFCLCSTPRKMSCTSSAASESRGRPFHLPHAHGCSGRAVRRRSWARHDRPAPCGAPPIETT